MKLFLQNPNYIYIISSVAIIQLHMVLRLTVMDSPLTARSSATYPEGFDHSSGVSCLCFDVWLLAD